MRFKVGDVVRLTEYHGESPSCHNPIGLVGIVRSVKRVSEVEGDTTYAVEFKDFEAGHSCGGYCAEDKGWICKERCLVPADFLIKRKGIVKFWKDNKIVA